MDYTQDDRNQLQDNQLQGDPRIPIQNIDTEFPLEEQPQENRAIYSDNLDPDSAKRLSQESLRSGREISGNQSGTLEAQELFGQSSEDMSDDIVKPPFSSEIKQEEDTMPSVDIAPVPKIGETPNTGQSHIKIAKEADGQLGQDGNADGFYETIRNEAQKNLKDLGRESSDNW